MSPRHDEPPSRCAKARTNDDDDVEVLLPAPTALSILRATNYGLLIKSHNKQKHKCAECVCVRVCRAVTNESKKERKKVNFV